MKKYLIFIIFIFNSIALNSITVIDKIKSSIKLNLPKITIESINPTAIPNMYEVVSGKKIFYVDSTGSYIFIGNMIDLKTKDNLTQNHLESISVVNWNSLPLNNAIRKVNGNGKYKIAIFTDPECVFCKRLEIETTSNLKDTTIYYFFFPLPNHAEAEKLSLQILCSEDTESAFTMWMKDGKLLQNRTNCTNAKTLKLMKDLGEKIGVEATPLIILPNGKIITGVVPADYLNQLILSNRVDN